MKPYKGQAIANAAGVAEVDLAPISTYDWEVYQIAISSTSAAFSTAQVFLDTRFMCGSNIGNADAADGSPITVRNGSSLRIVWNGCTPGAVCIVQILVMEGVIGSGVGANN